MAAQPSHTDTARSEVVVVAYTIGLGNFTHLGGTEFASPMPPFGIVCDFYCGYEAFLDSFNERDE